MSMLPSDVRTSPGDNSLEFPIGIVIPTYNRVDVLIQCLQHLEAQTFQAFEVIVVDDGSTDDTPQQLSTYTANCALHLRCLRQENGGAGLARNRGIALLHAPVCILIGDDILAGPSFVEEHLRFHQQHADRRATAIGLTRWSENGQTVTPFMRWLETDGVQFNYGALLAGAQPTWEHFYTSNLSLKTEQLGRFPFDSSLRGAGVEDSELGFRMAVQRELEMYFLPSALAEHVHPTDVERSCIRLIGVGAASYTFAKRWPEQAMVEASPWKERLRDMLMTPHTVLPLLRKTAALLTRAWCPNPVLKRVLTLHFKYGYRRAQSGHN